MKRIGFCYHWGIWTPDPTPEFRKELIYLRDQCGVDTIKLVYAGTAYGGPVVAVTDDNFRDALQACYEEGMKILLWFIPEEVPGASIVPGPVVEDYVRRGLDIVASDPNWAKLIVGIGGAMEMNCYDAWLVRDYTVEELDTFLRWEKALIRDIIRGNIIGDKLITYPIAYQPPEWTSYVPYAEVCGKYSDIPSLTVYIEDLADLRGKLTEWQSRTYVTGRRYWLQEFNGSTDAGGMAVMTPEILRETFNFNVDHASLYVMNADPSQPIYVKSWFTPEGDPRPPLLNLTPTIKSINTPIPPIELAASLILGSSPVLIVGGVVAAQELSKIL